MKKVLAIGLVLVMLLGTLVACSKSSNDTKETNDSQSSDTQMSNDTSNATKEETYNVIMQWPTVAKAPAGLADVEKAINDIVEPEIGVTVTLEPVNAYSLANETSLAISSGNQLDLVLSLFSGVGPLVNSGSIIPLNDLYAKYGSDIAEACGKRIAGGNYGDSLYGIPNAYIDGEKYGYVCRTDLLKKYGITIDENKVYTMDELGKIFATIKGGEGDGFYCIGGGQNAGDLFAKMYPYDVLGATNASGVLMMGKDFTSTKVQNLFETDEYKNFAETMFDWSQKGYFSPDASTTTEEGSTQVKAGNYLGWFAGTCSGGASDYNKQTGMDMTIITTIPGNSMSNLFQAILWSIPITSKNPEKTMEFLNYIYKDSRISTLLQFGIEGKSYEVVEQNEDGTVIKLPEGQTTDTVPYWQYFGVYGNRLAQPVMEPNPITTNKQLKEFSDSVKYFSPALGYCFITDNVSTEYSAVTAVIQQYFGIINTGAIDPAIEVPEFINALKSAGIDKIIEENQNQLDAWLKSKN